MPAPICHRDGTVTFWSVYLQSWRTCVRFVDDAELAAMTPRTRARVMRHLGGSRA